MVEMHLPSPVSLCLLLGTISFLWQSSQAKPRRRGMSYEDMVVNKVVESYKMRTVHSRPVLNYNDTLSVAFAIQLQQIMGLDEQNQVLTLNIWDQMAWDDHQIKWDEEEYGGVKDVRVPCHKIWTPDIKLYNYADLRLEEHRDALCVISSDGGVYHVPQVVYRSSCDIDVYVFPFDVQNCTLKFGSWAFMGNELDLKFFEDKNFIDMTQYLDSASWFIIDCPAFRHVINYTCCPDNTFVNLQYHLIFQRRSALYNYILILPCILLTSITLILFWIPPESPAKTQLGLAIFIAFFVLLKLLEKNLPPGTRHMPLLGTYYCLNMILITLSSFLNVLIVDLTTHGLRTATPPRVGKFFFTYLAKCLLMEDLVRPFVNRRVKTRTPKGGDLGNLEENKWKHDPTASNEALAQLQRDQTMQQGGGGPLAEIESKLNELREFMKLQQQRLKERDQKEIVAKQWKAVALILDRIFFIIYLCIITASLCYTLPVLTSVRSHYNSTLLDKARGINTTAA
ncbi:neuronal acetylcholine receptor subunit beta-3 [Aplysia californica]|uniref:Neuronal acetylcholine receptor subunit beta-3 n=1 Tax=Aplysia californica TaxID=6500 RepID=A0ABM0JIZ4_APLCA|nr:neuronal acetylcholine receptor subunit beta-3 [Aplysia californica]